MTLGPTHAIIFSIAAIGTALALDGALDSTRARNAELENRNAQVAVKMIEMPGGYMSIVAMIPGRGEELCGLWQADYYPPEP